MKITVYTINDCKFSQSEKDYLKKNSLEFEEKNLETNRDFLAEMLSISNNFAGTPVTKVTKDSGEEIILKGFTQEEFDKVLGVTTAPTTASVPETAVVATAGTTTETTTPQTGATAMANAPVVPTISEGVTSVTPTEQTTPTAAESMDSEKATEPIVVESLSQDVTEITESSDNMNNSVQIPSPMDQPTQAATPAPIEPMAAQNDNIGPISLDNPTTPTPVEPSNPVNVPAYPTPAAQPQEPAVTTSESPTPSASPQQPQTQTGADPLNSVLQNLQNQVNNGAGDQNNNQK